MQQRTLDTVKAADILNPHQIAFLYGHTCLSPNHKLSDE
jgi:hypothetical protein